MKGSDVAITLAAIPLRSSHPSSRERDDASARAWQRQMERAQMEAWLRHAVVGSADGTHPPGLMLGAKTMPTATVAMPDTLAAAAPTPAAGSQAGRGAASIDENATRPGLASSVFASSSSSLHFTAQQEAGSAGSDLRPRLDQVAVPRGPNSEMQGFTESPVLVALQREPFLQARELSAPHEEARSPGTAAATAATERLAVRLQSLGTVEVTTSIAGQPVVAEATSAGAPTSLAPSRVASTFEPCHLPWRSVPAERPEIGQPSLVKPSTTPTWVADGVPQLPPIAAGGCNQGLVPMLTSGAGGEARAVGAPVVTAARVREPIRLHADWSSDGVRLWLGMDSSLIGALQTLAVQLQRWLSGQGVRLLSISCNGRPIVDPHQESGSDDFEASLAPARPPVAAPWHTFNEWDVS